MKKKNLLICILLLTTNLFSFDKFEELRGSWIVSHFDKNNKNNI